MIHWDLAEKEHFLNELRLLVGRYPNIANAMVDTITENGEEHCDGCECTFDPNSPTILEGIALVLSHKNLDGWSDLAVISPSDQDRFVTSGLLTEAIKAL